MTVMETTAGREWFSMHGKMPRLHVPGHYAVGTELRLPDSVAGHLVRVLRLSVGAPLVIFDGHGNEAGALLQEVSRKQTTAVVRSLWPGASESPLDVHLGQAISKGDRMDYAIQKAVELGVAAITPLYTVHGDVRLKGERQARKQAHWQAIAASACEQCGRAVVPPVHSPKGLSDWLAKRQEPLRLMLHPGSRHAFSGVGQVASIAMLVGPEGGLGEEDITAAENANFISWALGPRILRTETAPVVALTLLQHHFGDFC